MFDFHSVVAAQESICGHRGVQARLSARGWFSDRTTRYLASGRTSVVQETGFTDHIRVGEGLLTFSTMDEAVSAVKAIEANYEAHTDAARDLAERYSSATSCSSAADSMRTSRVPHNRGARRRAQRPRDDHDPFQGSRWTVGPGEPLRRRESGREIDLYKSVLSRLQLGTAGRFTARSSSPASEGAGCPWSQSMVCRSGSSAISRSGSRRPLDCSAARDDRTTR
jgi:hypothetical protein